MVAALDAHVANHIVKHCILGLLKEKTRIIVTENRTLFYFANQILHVENGTVLPSDFALGSFDSDYGDDDADNELSSTQNFVLDNESNERNNAQTTEVSCVGPECSGALSNCNGFISGSERVRFTIVSSIKSLLEGVGSGPWARGHSVDHFDAGVKESVGRLAGALDHEHQSSECNVCQSKSKNARFELLHAGDTTECHVHD